MAEDNQFTPSSRPQRGPGSVRTGDANGKASSGHMIDDAKNIGNQVFGAVRESATSLLDEQRGRAADQIASIAGMVRNSVQSLDRQDAGSICRYAEDTARQIDGFADTLRNRSWSELADDVEDFARRWPVVFMASALATGFVAGRFLISSASRPSDTPAAMPTTSPKTGIDEEPRGGARYDYGAVSGPVSGNTPSGYGAGVKRD